MDFYGYRKDLSVRDSVTRFSQVLLGTSELETSEISILPKGTYLDITEDAWLSSDVTKLNLSGLIGDYLFKGSIPVPTEATVTGLQTWKGDTLYKAGLYESKYIYDKTIPDSLQLQESLNSRIALLQKHTDYSYELTMTRVALGERKHVRLRYLLRTSNTGSGTFQIPVLLHSQYGSNPRNIKFKVYADNDKNSFTLNTDKTCVLLTDTSTNLIPYRQTIQLVHSNQNKSALNISEFTSDPYRGNYISVNTVVQDTLIKQLSKHISTVFIWRWNDSTSMIEFQNQMKALSGYALSIIDQASRMKETILELKKLGNHIGLVHTIEGKTSLSFSSAALNDKEDSLILQYLNSFTKESMYNRYAPLTSSPDPSWIPHETSTSIIEKSRTELLQTLSKASSLLQNDTINKYHHIILLSAGSAPDNNLINMNTGISEITKGYSLTAPGVQWRGIDIGASFPLSNTLYTWKHYLFPSFSPIIIQLRISNTQQPFSFPLTENDWKKPLSITGRTSAQWDSVLVFTGIDSEGKQTGTVNIKPMVFKFFADSGLAKIWANDKEHIADNEEIYPGGTFGILTKATYFQATLKSIIEDDHTKTCPYLNDDEIFAPKSAIKNQVVPVKKSIISLANGVLNITTPRNFTTLKIIDLSGRVLLSIDIKKYRTGITGFRIPMNQLLTKFASRKITIVLSGDGTEIITHLCGGVL
jgi:hypothetical protein